MPQHGYDIVQPLNRQLKALATTQVPGYKVERLIAEGGMASVYLAVQETLGRRVALKVLRKFDDPTESERFLKEGRIIASLNHRNIITVYDVGVFGGQHYISMEYLEGGALEKRIAEGMNVDEALDLVETIGGCLGLIHRKGLVHRDIKPANILFHQDGTPILTDFGIAKEVDTDTRLTRDGAALGSPCYLSPEQAECKPLDGRADIYGLGIILHEMLTGRKPYQADSYIETIVAHLTEPLPTLPPELDRYQDLLDRMIGKDREDRFGTAGELVAYVQQLRLAQPAEGFASKALGLVRQLVDTQSLSHAANRVIEGARSGLHMIGRVLPSERRTRLALGGGLVVLLTSAVLLLDGDKPGGSGVRETAEPGGQTTAPAAEQVETQTAAVARSRFMELPEPEPAVPSETAAQEPATIETTSPAAVPPSPTLPANPEPATAVEATPETEEHLRLAREALDQYRLMVPEKDSAYSHYQQVLHRDPDNVEALRGLTEIAEIYADLVEKELDQFHYPTAKRYLQRGLTVQPDNKRLLALREQTDALRDSPKRLIGKIKSVFD